MQMHDTYIKRSTENQDNGEKGQQSNAWHMETKQSIVNTEDEIVHT